MRLRIIYLDENRPDEFVDGFYSIEEAEAYIEDLDCSDILYIEGISDL